MSASHGDRNEPGSQPIRTGLDRVESAPDTRGADRIRVEPVKLLILALGGEGGGVLARWLVEAGIRAGHVVQSTSIPGVAQRTGATSYYLEWLPVERRRLAGQEPVLCLSPMAGDLDLLVSSEMLEAARAAERGMPDPERTLVLSSSSRVLTVAEKSALGDGRLAADAMREKLRSAAGELITFDMQALAREAGTVISAVMFGAIFASGRLPLAREHCEAVIGASGRGAQASLRGFAAGAQAVTDALQASGGRGEASAADARSDAGASSAPASDVGGVDAHGRTPATDEALPAALRELMVLAGERLRDYLDAAYAQAFDARVRAWATLERNLAGASSTLPVTQEAARQLARWMAYEDVIRVADLKIRAERFESLEREATGGAGGVTRTWDYLKPGIDEIAAILPPKPAEWLRGVAARRGWRTVGGGMRLQSTGLFGMIALRSLAGLRGWRRRSSRFADESALIERWDRVLSAALARDAELAAAVASAPSLIKGYSDTYIRGRGRFVQVLEQRIESRDGADGADGASGADAAAQARAIRRAVAAARADAQGIALAHELGLPAPSPVAQPIRFIPRRRPPGGAA
ncbi:MAG: indolepyruvate oxidoreductase subunit beta family protein [Burkholderiaceae bacterium]